MAAATTSAALSCGREDVLLDAYAYLSDITNRTAAVDFTPNGKRIIASFWRASPPHISRLNIHSPDLDFKAFSELPRILCIVEGVILFRVAIGCPQPKCIAKEECDYFIYQVDLPRLHRLPHPAPVCFRDDEVGLLPRGDHYNVAALVASDGPFMFTLRLFQSNVGSWTSVKLTLQTPPREFPIKIPKIASRLNSHCTSTVITLGVEGDTMGWVDLWSGILLCNVLSPNPTLRHVCLPVPMARLKCSSGNELELGCPKPYRGIAFDKEKACLRLVDLDVSGVQVADADEETGGFSFRIDKWTITTWINVNLTGSSDDWLEDHPPLDAKDIGFSDHIRRQLLGYQLLRSKPSPQDKSVTVDLERNLENLWVRRPAPSMGGTNVVYLMASPKFMHLKACVLSVDMEGRKLQRVAEFGTERELGADFSHGSFSKNSSCPPTSLVLDGNLAMLEDEVQQEVMLWGNGFKGDASKIEV